VAGRGKRRFAVHLPLQRFFFAGINWRQEKSCERRGGRGAGPNLRRRKDPAPKAPDWVFPDSRKCVSKENLRRSYGEPGGTPAEQTGIFRPILSSGSRLETRGFSASRHAPTAPSGVCWDEGGCDGNGDRLNPLIQGASRADLRQMCDGPSVSRATGRCWRLVGARSRDRKQASRSRGPRSLGWAPVLCVGSGPARLQSASDRARQQTRCAAAKLRTASTGRIPEGACAGREERREWAIQEGFHKPTVYAPSPPGRYPSALLPSSLAYRLTMPTGASLLPGPRAALHLRLYPRDSRSTESKQRHALQRFFERKGGYLRRCVRRPRARAPKLFAL
jgi:hypothetical protein